MSDLNALVAAIVEDGVVDKAEVQQLRAEFYDEAGSGGSAVSREEADALFAINDAVSGNPNCVEYGDFFVEALTKHVLEDEETPGELDEDEAAYIHGKIEGDGQVDLLEKRLVQNIVAEATSVPDSFREWAASL